MRGAPWRKVRADLLTNKLRSALAVTSLAVGTTAVGAMFLAGTTVDASFEAAFDAANPPSAMLITGPFTPELVEEAAAHPAVGQAEGRRLHRTQVIDVDGERLAVELVAMPDFADNQVAIIEPTAGTWPPEPGSIALERASAEEFAAELGDSLGIAVPGGSPIELALSATTFDVYEVAPMLGGPIRGYVSMETMADLTGSDHLDALFLRAETQPESRAQALQMTMSVRDDVLTPAGVTIEFSAIDEPGEHRASDSISFITLAMQLLSLLALGIAVALVVNTVAALLAQQRTQIGVMKAIGATTRHLMTQYLTYVLVLSCVAVAVSVPLSILLGLQVAGFIAYLANIDVTALGVPFSPILLQVAIATLLPITAVIFTVRRASRTTVREAINDQGLTSPARPPRLGIPFSRPTVLAYRNAARNRGRVALTVLTIALCGAVLVGVMNTGSGLGELSDQVAGYSDYDVALTVVEPVSVEAATDVLEDDAAVAVVEGWLRRQAFRIRPDGTENDNIDVTGIPVRSSSVSPTLLEGRWYEAGDDHAIVINTHMADEEPDLEVGGAVVLEVAGTRQEWEIVGIATTTLVGPVAYVAADELAEMIGEPHTADLLAVQLTPDADADAAAERLASLARDAGLPVAQVQTHAEVRETTDSLFDIAVALLLVVGAILAVVAVVGVAGTMTLNVVEQTREIGVLRTLGATTWSVRRLLLLQGLAIAAVGGVVGVLLSVLVTLLLGAAIGSTLISAEFPLAFSWLGVGIWTVVALAIGALGATHPSRVASRLTIRDTLAYE